MKTIVIVRIWRRRSPVWPQEEITAPGTEGARVEEEARTPIRRLASSTGEQTPPPFWTWFIENPRVGDQVSI